MVTSSGQKRITRRTQTARDGSQVYVRGNNPTQKTGSAIIDVPYSTVKKGSTAPSPRNSGKAKAAAFAAGVSTSYGGPITTSPRPKARPKKRRSNKWQT